MRIIRFGGLVTIRAAVSERSAETLALSLSPFGDLLSRSSVQDVSSADPDRFFSVKKEYPSEYAPRFA